MSFRILLAGLGNRGRTWADIIASQRDATLAAACDPSERARDELAQRHPGVALHASLASALAADRYDAVVLATPPDGHLEQARAIFAAGLPLLCEKPLATDLAEARAIVELAERERRMLAVGLNFRFLPVHQTLKAMIAQETLGPAGFGQFTYQRNRDGRAPRLNKYPLTMRHPMLLEQSIHHLDLIRFCYGREARRVACRTWNPGWSMYAHDSNVSCLIELEGGLEVNYLGTWTGGWDELRFEWRTDCRDGVLIQRQLFSDLVIARTRDAAPMPVEMKAARAFIDDTADLLGAFVAALRDGAPPPCDGRDHLRSLALCFAAIESAEHGVTVEMPAFEARLGLAR
jgi:predicted dehydrogenase